MKVFKKIGFFMIAFLLFFAFACGKDDKKDEDKKDDDEIVEEDYKDEKEASIASLESFVNGLDKNSYTTENWDKIQGILLKAKDDINNSDSLEGIESVKTKAISDINNVEIIVDENKVNRDAAISEITRYFKMYVESDYSSENWALIKGYYDDCIVKINSLTDKGEMDSAVLEAKTSIVQILTIAEEEDELFYAKIEEAKVTLTEYFEKYPQSEFEYSNYYTFMVTYTEAIELLDDCETMEEVNAILNDTLKALGDIPRLLKISYYNIDDVTWEFKSILDMRLELLADYNAFNNSTYTLETIPTAPFQHINYDAFYYSEGMMEKWGFLVEFFSEKANTSNNRSAYTLLYQTKSYDDYLNSTTYNKENTPYAISYEFKAFLSGTVVRAGHTTYGTNDYNDKDLCSLIWNYLKPIDSYEKGLEYTYPTPYRKYQEFLGWYDNPEFAGDPITGITKENNEKISLYAKWSELSVEDEFNIYKDSKVNEFTEYFENTKDQSKYNDTAWNDLLKTFENCVNDINSQTTKEEVDNAFINSKEALDSLKETIFIVSYELDGGHWYFNNKEELSKKLLADYSKFKGETITADTFFERSYGSLTVFLNNYKEWIWFLDFLKANCVEGKEDCYDFEKGLVEAQVRAEIAGYLLGKKAVYSGYESGDYSDGSKDNGFFEYAVTREFSYLEETTSLMTPIKEGYKFVGWYKDANFTGEVVTSVNEAVTLYAKWEKIN